MIKFLLDNIVVFLLGPILLYVSWRFFGKSWKKLDEESNQWNSERLAKGERDLRPLAVFSIVTVVLTWNHYYGGGTYFEDHILPWLTSLDSQYPEVFQLSKFFNLYSYAWWSLANLLAFVVIPFVSWKFMYPKDSLLDFGLRTDNFFKHKGIYAIYILIMLANVALIINLPGFVDYYPYYKYSTRSWLDFLLWEAMYIPGFLALEIFFRGFWLVALRKSMGSAAIFTMLVPYAMIHFGKPYPEALGAGILGIWLGSLSIQTRSVYQGTIVHLSMAIPLDLIALFKKGFPTEFWP